MKKQKKKQIASKTLKKRQKKVTAPTQIATKTAKSHSWETLVKTLTQLKLKKIGRIHEKKHETSRGKYEDSHNIPCWIVTHKKVNWRLAMRIAISQRQDGQKKQQNGIQA